MDEREKYLIKNTTKEQRIELIRSWLPQQDMDDADGFDLWDLYDEYIRGNKEISECNEEFSKNNQNSYVI